MLMHDACTSTAVLPRESFCNCAATFAGLEQSTVGIIETGWKKRRKSQSSWKLECSLGNNIQIYK